MHQALCPTTLDWMTPSFWTGTARDPPVCTGRNTAGLNMASYQ